MSSKNEFTDGGRDSLDESMDSTSGTYVTPSNHLGLAGYRP